MKCIQLNIKYKLNINLPIITGCAQNIRQCKKKWHVKMRKKLYTKSQILIKKN